jgi:hypothetical protein
MTLAALCRLKTLAALFGPCLISSASAAPAGEWSLSGSLGYDNEVLADPERDGVVAPVSAPFGAIESLLHLAWSQVGGARDLAAVTLRAAGSRYRGEGPDHDVELRGTVRYYRLLSPRLALEGGLGLWRFRRDDLPLFDLDLVGVESGLTRRLDAEWVGGLRLSHAWPSFPGRVVSDDPRATESDRQLDVSATVIRELAPGDHVRIEIGYRRTASNDPLIAYDGPLAVLRAACGGPGRARFWTYVAYGRRSYRDYPVLTPGGVDTGADRSDETWRFGMDVERALSPRLQLFVSAAATRQTSNIGALEFDQLRLLGGVRVALWRAGGVEAYGPGGSIPELLLRRGGGPSPDLAPRKLPAGVRFRCRAPGAVKVAVVGGFNRWDAVRNPMSDPDGDGVWEVVVPIAPGTWRYAFVVDGRWQRPEAASRFEDDGFGGANGVIEVK